MSKAEFDKQKREKRLKELEKTAGKTGGAKPQPEKFPRGGYDQSNNRSYSESKEEDDDDTPKSKWDPKKKKYVKGFNSSVPKDSKDSHSDSYAEMGLDSKGKPKKIGEATSGNWAKKPAKSHDSDCKYPYGGDCDCGESDHTHASDCGWNYGHDCDCGYNKLKQKKIGEAGKKGMTRSAKERAAKDKAYNDKQFKDFDDKYGETFHYGNAVVTHPPKNPQKKIGEGSETMDRLRGQIRTRSDQFYRTRYDDTENRHRRDQELADKRHELEMSRMDNDANRRDNMLNHYYDDFDQRTQRQNQQDSDSHAEHLKWRRRQQRANNDLYKQFLNNHSGQKNVGEGTNSQEGVDAYGRTQKKWLYLVKINFPDAKISQSKMIDGPCRAVLPGGRIFTWAKVEKPLGEGWEKMGKATQQKVRRDRAGQRVRTPEGEGVIKYELKSPTFSQSVPFVHIVVVQMDDGKSVEVRAKQCKLVKAGVTESDSGGTCSSAIAAGPAQNLLAKKPAKKKQSKISEGIALSELNQKTYRLYMQKVANDAQKHDMDPTKRAPEKANKSAAAFGKAYDKAGGIGKEPLRVESQVNELDNGPKGKYKGDNVKYGAARHVGGGIPSPEELAARKAPTKAPVKKAAPAKAPVDPAIKQRNQEQKRREKEAAMAERKIEKVRASLGSAKPTNPLEKKAKDAMFDVWNAIAPDVIGGYESQGWEDKQQLEDPYYVSELCFDANRLQQFAHLSRQEEEQIIGLGHKTLARLALDFGV
jgi:hypothetical protein